MWRFLVACRRLWFIVALGLVSTATAGAVVHGHRGVYYTNARVLFIRPFVAHANPLTDGNSLISTASIVQRAVSGTNHVRFTSQDITLADAGVRRGSRVTMWNDGNQWNNHFDEPVLRVEVVGPTSRDVSGRITTLVNEINRDLRTKQAASDVAPSAQITTLTILAGPNPAYLQGSPYKALLTVLLLGLGLTAAAVNVVHAYVSERAAGLRNNRSALGSNRKPEIADPGKRVVLPVP